MPAKKPLVIVTRKLPEVVETRMRELFDARLNIDDRPMKQAELAVQQALQQHAPDLLGMDVEGVLDEDQDGITGVALPMTNGSPGWHTLGIEAPEVLAVAAVDGTSLTSVVNAGSMSARGSA